jgi:long-chain acyl-CoA synthetase
VRTHLASLVEDFRHHAGEIAVVNHRGIRRHATTYGELAQLAGRFAAELDRRGVLSGDRVVLWGTNSAEWIGAFFGCLLRGAIAVPLDAAGAPEFASRVVRDVAPKLVVGDRALLDSLTGADRSSFLLLSNLAGQLPRQPNFAVAESVTALAPFQIVFTSGTTSEPKGIVHTHRNVLVSVAPIEREMAKYRRIERVFHPLRFLHTLPLSHVFGQFMGLWLPPLLAAEIHFVEQVEARRMTELIRRERISVLVAVPRILQLLRAHLLGRFDGLAEQLEATKSQSKLSKWWTFRHVHNLLGWKFWAVICGGATLPQELEEFWGGIGIPVIQGYGMTETTALVTLNSPFKIGKGTIGKTLPGREVRLSETGEIQVRGDMLATSTWSGGKMVAREGEWLSTGDIGERNEHGELRFLGRKDDVIVTGGGMNIHPADLENALKKQPGIRECAVVPCETSAGEEPVAVVLLSAPESQLPQAVQEANKELAAFQQIRRVLVWPEVQFPYTSTGKLLRRKIAEWVCQAVSQPSGTPVAASKSGKASLLDMIAEVTGEPVPQLATEGGDRLRLGEDLHLDSLGRVQLQSSLEQQLGLEFADDALSNLETLGQLRALIAEESGAPAATAQSEPAQASPHTRSPMPVTTSAPSPDESKLPAAQAPLDTPIAAHSPSRASGKANGDLQALTSQEMYPRWPWNWFFAPLRDAFQELVSRPLIWLLGSPRITLPAGDLPDGPLLVIANHVTAYDGALILYALPRRLRRRLAIAMVGEMLLDLKRGRNQGNWFLNLAAPPQYWLVTALYNVFPMPRAHGFRKSFQHAGEAMDRGYNVLIFPEGARYYEGGIRPFRQGIGLIVQEARVPVLPVALLGLEEMHREGRWFRSGKLEVRIGQPISFDETAEPAEVTAKLEGAVRQLCNRTNPG